MRTPLRSDNIFAEVPLWWTTDRPESGGIVVGWYRLSKDSLLGVSLAEILWILLCCGRLAGQPVLKRNGRANARFRGGKYAVLQLCLRRSRKSLNGALRLF